MKLAAQDHEEERRGERNGNKKFERKGSAKRGESSWSGTSLLKERFAGRGENGVGDLAEEKWERREGREENGERGKQADVYSYEKIILKRGKKREEENLLRGGTECTC